MTDIDLEDGICTWAGRIAAGEARLLSLLAEYDRREAWAVPGHAVVRALAVLADRPGSGSGP